MEGVVEGVEKGGGQKQLLIKVSAELHSLFKSCAAREGQTMTEVLSSLMKMYIDQYERKNRSRRSRG